MQSELGWAWSKYITCNASSDNTLNSLSSHFLLPNTMYTLRTNDNPPSDAESDDSSIIMPPPPPPAQRRRLNNGDGNRAVRAAAAEARRVANPPVAAAAEAPPQARFGGFVDRNGNMLPNRQPIWMNCVHIFANHNEGLHGSLGYGRRTRYFAEQTDALFSATGPLGAFRRIAPHQLQGHVAQVINAARAIYNQGHSNGDGGEFEDIPEWARIIFPLFDGNAQRDAARREHQAIVRGVVGAQAPLGRVPGNHPAQLRNERSNNDGAAELRQRVVGGVHIHRGERVEGRDDRANRLPMANARARRRNRNRVRHRNIHLGNDEDFENDYAGRRSDDIRYGLQSMRMLVDGIHRGMIEQPRRTVREVVNDISQIMNDRRGAEPAMLPVLDMALTILRRELEELAAANGEARPGDDELP